MSHQAPSVIDRRTWLTLAAVNTVAWALRGRPAAAQGPASSARDVRIRRLIRAYEEQGFHRTGTSVDDASARWLRDEVGQAGLTGSLEPFPFHRVDVVSAGLSAGGRRVDALPLFDGAFTDGHGVRGRLGSIDGDAEIGLTDSIPNAAGSGPLGEARRRNRHKAIVCITRGRQPGLCPSNADAFLEPFGPPVLQVSSEHASWLEEQAQRGGEVHVLAHVRRTPAEAFNVTARITGADPTLPPLVIMTPRSGWYWCASERGGGLACWLELMRVLPSATPARDVLFVASSGHELGHLGINAFVERRSGIVSNSVGWIHLGANIGAARSGGQPRPPGNAAGAPSSATLPQGEGNTVQASDDQIDRLLAQAMASVGLTVDRRTPRDRVPGGEAEVVHRGGGRYVSVIGSNAMFHNPSDRGPGVIDARAIGAFAEAFATVAAKLAGREP